MRDSHGLRFSVSPNGYRQTATQPANQPARIPLTMDLAFDYCDVVDFGKSLFHRESLRMAMEKQ